MAPHRDPAASLGEESHTFVLESVTTSRFWCFWDAQRKSDRYCRVNLKDQDWSSLGHQSHYTEVCKKEWRNICLWVNCVVLHCYRCILLRFYCSFLCIVDVVCITRYCFLVIFVSNYFLVGLILTETHHFQVLTLILSNMPITLPKNPQYFTSSDSDTSSLFADSNEFWQLDGIALNFGPMHV